MRRLRGCKVLDSNRRDVCSDLRRMCFQFRRVLQRLQRIERVHVQRRFYRPRRRAVRCVSDRHVEERNRLRIMHRLPAVLRRDVHPMHRFNRLSMQRRLLRPERRLVLAVPHGNVQEHERPAGVLELSRELWNRRQRFNYVSLRHRFHRPRRRCLHRMRRRDVQKRRGLSSMPGVPSVVVPGRWWSLGVRALSHQRRLARR